MKITSMALMVWMAGTAAFAGPPQQKLTVYVEDNANLPGAVSIPAKAMASRMFAKIGISLDWRTGAPAGEFAERPILIEIAEETPNHFKPGALAYALPFESSHSHIVVFFDRVKNTPYPMTVLAHVMVHEITHLLQCSDQHSATGIMKARWTGHDFDAMRFEPFLFTQEDVDLIYTGLAKRGGTVALAALAGRP